MWSCYRLPFRLHAFAVLGVVRRIIHQWTSGQHCYKLSQGLLSAISDRLVSLQPFIPTEISRKPRSLLEHKLWKATELRLFLIYTGRDKCISAEEVCLKAFCVCFLFESVTNFVEYLKRLFVKETTFCYGYSYCIHSAILYKLTANYHCLLVTAQGCVPSYHTTTPVRLTLFQ